MRLCKRAARPVVGLFLLFAILAGCGKLTFPRLTFKSEEPQAPGIPLTVRVEIPDVLKNAQLFYRDSCNVPRGIPLGERLAEQVKADAAQVFEKTFEGDPKQPADAVLTASMDTGEINLNIPRREIGEYPLRVLIRLRVNVTDAEGKILFNDSIKAEGKWTVRTDGTECTVQGLMVPVTEAIEKLSDRFVESLTQSVKIRDAAIRLRTRQEMLASGKSPAGVPSEARGGADAPTLSFRASLEDENRNQILEGGEKVVVRVEVSNSGPGVAKGVAVVLTGTPALVKEFTTPTFLGDIQPGEKKQVAISTTLSSSLADQQAELIIQITEASGFGAPTRKRFVASMQPGGASEETVEVLSVDVDQIPARAPNFERRTSYAIVIGIGSYREETVPKLKYAKRDAEVVVKHLTAIGGFPKENVRVLTDERALLTDLQEVFEEWLPNKAKASGIVLVYLVGNGVVSPTGGEPVLLPYEGKPEAASRGYSIRRIQEVLRRLPSRLNLVFADLSFLPGSNAKAPMWTDRTGEGRGRIVLVSSSSAAGPTLVWEAGQHGLFTYQFLKAIRGQADANDNGWVELGEIVRHLREQVPARAAELHKEQQPAVTPDVDPAGPIGTFPISKAKRGNVRP